VAAGRGVAEGRAIGPVHLVDVAPSVARLLGFAPPEGVDGRVLEGIIRETIVARKWQKAKVR